MQITLQWLQDNKAPNDLYTWAVNYFGVQTQVDSTALVNELVTEEHYDWANFIVLRILDRTKKIQYGIYATQQCINNFIVNYPNDGRPSEALSSAIIYLSSPTKENSSRASTASEGASMSASVAKSVNSEDTNVHTVVNMQADAVNIYNSIVDSANANTSIHSAMCAHNLANMCCDSEFDIILGGYAPDNYTFNYAVEVYNSSATSQAWNAYVTSIQTNGGYAVANQQYALAYTNAKIAMINYGLSLI